MTGTARHVFAAAARDGTLFVLGGSLVAALFSYLFQLIGGRALGSDGFAPIGVLWTVQFLAITIVLIPIEQMTVRRLVIAPDHRLRHDVRLIGAVVGGTALAVFALMWVFRDTFLDGRDIHAAQAGLLVVGYGVFATGRGALGGRARFRSYGLSTATDATVRLAFAGAVIAVTATSVGLGWAMVVAPWTVLAFRPFRRNATAGDRDRSAPAAATGFLVAFIVANAASNVILAAGPLVVVMLGGEPTAVSAFFVTLILVRAPLAFSYGMLTRVLAPMAKMASTGQSARLRSWAVRISSVGALALVPAWLTGRVVVPDLIEMLFGSEFRPTAQLGGLIAAGVVAAIASVVLGQILVARGQTVRLAAAWLVALSVAAAAVGLSSGVPAIRVGVGFLAGEIIALAGIALTTIAGGRRAPLAAGAARQPGP